MGEDYDSSFARSVTLPPCLLIIFVHTLPRPPPCYIHSLTHSLPFLRDRRRRTTPSRGRRRSTWSRRSRSACACRPSPSTRRRPARPCPSPSCQRPRRAGRRSSSETRSKPSCPTVSACVRPLVLRMVYLFNLFLLFCSLCLMLQLYCQ